MTRMRQHAPFFNTPATMWRIWALSAGRLASRLRRMSLICAITSRFFLIRGVLAPCDVSRADIVAYESDLVERGYAASTISRRVSAVKGFHLLSCFR